MPRISKMAASFYEKSGFIVRSLALSLAGVLFGSVYPQDLEKLYVAGETRAAISMKNRVSQRRVSTKSSSETSHTARGEGVTLPKGIWRTQFVNKSYFGKSGFSDSGENFDLGFRARVDVSAFALEYGVSDRLTLQLMVPYVRSNSLRVDANRFRRSEVYKEKYRAAISKIAARLSEDGLCGSEDDCFSLVHKGYFHSPINITHELDTGERVSIDQQVDIRTAVDSIIIGAVRPEDGKSGLGDIELGG